MPGSLGVEAAKRSSRRRRRSLCLGQGDSVALPHRRQAAPHPAQSFVPSAANDRSPPQTDRLFVLITFGAWSFVLVSIQTPSRRERVCCPLVARHLEAVIGVEADALSEDQF